MQLRLHGLFCLGFAKFKLLVYYFEIPLNGFKSPRVVGLYAITCFNQFLVVNLILVDAFSVKGYRNLSNLTGVTHKFSKSFLNVISIFLLYLAALELDPKRFRVLWPSLNSAKLTYL